jgi:hypothetical protein
LNVRLLGQNLMRQPDHQRLMKGASFMAGRWRVLAAIAALHSDISGTIEFPYDMYKP